ncbi:MAG TPA: TetR/AcrR family transcriptional regulator [Anaeromyxobacteraceae bacterium]|nr:TetR/AcrR family transcriptional regulator [Anaeromyxobacteraceae bacterium]
MRERVRQATRATILQAAERVFSDRGIGAARMEEIAEQAGVAVGTIYNYFDDRHALLQAVLDASAAELEQRLSEAESTVDEPFKRQVERFFAKVLEHQQAHFRLFAILAQEEAGLCRPPSAAEPQRLRLKALHLLAERLVARGVAQGALRAEDADLFPTFLSNILRGLFLRDLLATGGPPRLEEAPRLARFFLHGAGGHR